MSASLSLHEVKNVKITAAFQPPGSSRTIREIVVNMQDGSTITIELFTTNDDMKLEIE